jgi:hypothetical protein
MSSDIKNHVQHIVSILENGFGDELNVDGQEFSAFDYLQEALDIEWILNSKKEYLGARVLVAFGGPNIWVNTRTNQVEGYFWGDSYITSFSDNVGLNEALEELFNC